MDADNKLEGFEEKPEQPKSDAASLGIYVISRTLLINLLNQIIPEGRYSLVKDIIIRFIHTLKIYGYEYDGYWNAIGTGIAAYFETNMDFLKRISVIILSTNIPILKQSRRMSPLQNTTGARM